MKIGITFFGSQMDLLCISKVLTIFCVFSKIRQKRKHSRGHMACSPSARGGLPVWGLSGRGPLGELPGGALSARPRGTCGGLGSIRGKSPGERVLGTRVVLTGLPDVVYGLSIRGQVACSATSGGNITRWTRGALGGFREGCVALGGFRESCGSGTQGHVSFSEGDSERGFEGWL